ncbi:hypothetical protein, partial [Burkholderia mallei]|uniref:hypothetical protein n=1 Tax=Burkholderia mallei TaxID=13373 RepID=UPI001E51E787
MEIIGGAVETLVGQGSGAGRQNIFPFPNPPQRCVTATIWGRGGTNRVRKNVIIDASAIEVCGEYD